MDFEQYFDDNQHAFYERNSIRNPYRLRLGR